MNRLRTWWNGWSWRRSQRKRMDAAMARWLERPVVIGAAGRAGVDGPRPYESWDEFVRRM